MATNNRIFVPEDSTEYVAVKVTGLDNGQVINLSGVPVEIGIRPVHDGTLGPVVFHTADWELVNGQYYARILIGPEAGAVFLALNTYNLWVKVYATPQLIVRKSPTILEIRPSETQ